MSENSILKQDNKRSLLINLAIMVAIGIALLLLFFYVYLPITTSHGKTMPAPNLIGKMEADLEPILKEGKLRYQIIDSTYNPDLPPNSILDQTPRPGASIKRKRKIYLTTNYAVPPSVEVPQNLVTQSLENAKIQIRLAGLKVGQVKEEASDYNGVVIGIIADGQEIRRKNKDKVMKVKKGATIDIIVGKRKSYTVDEDTDTED